MNYDAPPRAYPPPPGPLPHGQWPPIPPQDDATARRGGFVGFMTSLPGVLTAVAGLLSAVTGGVGLYVNSQDKPDTDTQRGGEVYIVEADPVPEEEAEVDVGSLDTALPEASGDDQFTILANGCMAGDYGACDELQHLLADECYLADPASCDLLYWISEPGSGFEDYGATCGGRVEDWSWAGYCSEA